MVCGICNKKECWGCHVDHESSQPFLNESVAKLVSLGIAIDWNSDFIHDHPVLENSHVNFFLLNFLVGIESGPTSIFLAIV